MELFRLGDKEQEDEDDEDYHIPSYPLPLSPKHLAETRRDDALVSIDSGPACFARLDTKLDRFPASTLTFPRSTRWLVYLFLVQVYLVCNF